MPKIAITNENRAQISNTLQQYIYNNDFNGAAQYMSQIRRDNKDPYIRSSLEKEYHAMELQGHKYQAALNATTDNAAKQAYAFTYSMDNKGNFGNMQGNQFYQQWANAVDTAFGDDATGISVRFAPQKVKRSFLGIDWLASDIERNEDGYSLFKRQIGMTEDQLKNLGVTFTNNSDGTVTMGVSKDNKPTMYRIMQALAKTNTKYDGSVDGHEDIDDSDAIPMWQMYGVNANGQVTGVPKNFLGSNQNSGQLDKDDNNHKVGAYYENDAKDAFNTDALQRIFGIQKQAREYYDKMSNKPSNKVMSGRFANRVDLTVLNHSKADNQGNALPNKELVEQLKSALGQVSLADYNVYADITGDDASLDSGTKVASGMEKIKTGSQRQNISYILHNAVANNNVYISDAVIGDMIGKYITVPPQTNKGEEITPGINVFVQDLFGDSQSAINFANDTKTRALLEVNAMDLYNYDQEAPDLWGDGNSRLHPIGDGQNYIYTNAKGETSQIDKSEAQRLLNSKFIIQDAISNIQDAAYNENGTPRRGYDTFAAYRDLSKYVPAGVADVYPDIYSRLVQSFQNYDDAQMFDSYGNLNPSYANNNELLANDIDQYNYLAQAFYRYIFNLSGLKDIFAQRARGNYDN